MRKYQVRDTNGEVLWEGEAPSQEEAAKAFIATLDLIDAGEVFITAKLYEVFDDGGSWLLTIDLNDYI